MSNAGIFMRVMPEVLFEKAQEVSGKVRDIQERFQVLEQIVQTSTFYWKGDAGDLHRNIYLEHKDKIENVIRALEEQARDLGKISENYIEADTQISSIIEDLPDDIII